VTPRDVLGLGAALERVGEIRGALDGVAAAALATAAGDLDPLPALCAEIAADDQRRRAAQAAPGQMVRAGCHAEIDELRELALHGKRFFVEYEARERQRTGITSLKVRYNQGVRLLHRGHQAEPAPRARGLPPQADHRHGRALRHAGARRVRGQGARRRERLGALEGQLFAALVTTAAAHHAALARTAAALARLDVFAALALVAERRRYAGRRSAAIATSPSPTGAIRSSRRWPDARGSSPTTVASIRTTARS
jgi:DNA mismatch repair protein MutS